MIQERALDILEPLKYLKGQQVKSWGSTMRRKWDEQKFTTAVAESFSVAGVLRHLGLTYAGNSYEVVREECERLGLDTSHWNGKGHKPQKLPLAEMMVLGTKTATATLKRRMLQEGLLVLTCALCGLEPVWQGQPLTLRLDHINGDRTDARRENIRLLCPNCDSQTDTFCGRNVKRTEGKRMGLRIKSEPHRCSCGSVIRAKSLRCRSCARKNQQPPPRHQPTKIDWPPLDVLLARLQTAPVTTLAKELGVSDNAVTKHLRHLGAKKGSSGWGLE